MSRNKKLITLIAVLLVVGAGGTAYFLALSSDTSAPPTTMQNTATSVSIQNLLAKPQSYIDKKVVVKGHLVNNGGGYYSLVADNSKTYQAISMDFSKTTLKADTYASSNLSGKKIVHPPVAITGKVVFTKGASAPRLVVISIN
jgi:hypothetical protein